MINGKSDQAFAIMCSGNSWASCGEQQPAWGCRGEGAMRLPFRPRRTARVNIAWSKQNSSTAPMQRYSTSVSLFPGAMHRCIVFVHLLHGRGATLRRTSSLVTERGATLRRTHSLVPEGSATLHHVRVPVPGRTATLHQSRATVAQVRSNAAPCPCNSSQRQCNAAPGL